MCVTRRERAVAVHPGSTAQRDVEVTPKRCKVPEGGTHRQRAPQALAARGRSVCHRDDSVAHRLREILSHALLGQCGRQQQCGVELYSGKGFVTRQLRRKGVGTIAWDWSSSAVFNLLVGPAFLILTGCIEAGIVVILRMGTPCRSWSRARRAPLWSRMPHRLRIATAVYGLKELVGNDSKIVEEGNLLSKRGQVLYATCRRLSVSWSEDNPAQSYLWLEHGRISRQQVTAVSSYLFTMCAFGAPYKKRTRIDEINVLFPELEAADCTSRICVFKKCRHMPLSGLSEGKFVTSAAAAYPLRLARVIANGHFQAWERRQAISLWKLFRSKGAVNQDTGDG